MPTPRANETERQFIARCVIDDESRRDFPNLDQRLAFCYSQYENREKPIYKNTKRDESYLTSLDRQINFIENKNIKSLTQYYQKNYNNGVQNFIDYNDTKFESLFSLDSLQKEYQKMYVSMGNYIASWYFRGFNKYISKADPKPYQNEWERSFAYYGGQVAATNVTLVSGTAKKTLVKVTQQLMRDPEFMSLGASQKARILRTQFRQYSKFQAERVVRTESTRAANFALETSAKTLYAENDLTKRWMTAIDGRERPAHREANGQVRKLNENFIVGGEEMPRPGEGSAKNVINCRCRMIFVPDENAIPVTELDDFGVGLGGQDISSFNFSNVGNTVSAINTFVAQRQNPDVNEENIE